MRKLVQLSICIALLMASTSFAADSTPTLPLSHGRGRPITPEQLQRAQQKLAHAQQVVSQFADRARVEGLPDKWRFQMLTQLMQAREAQFDEVASAATTRDALSRVQEFATRQAHASGSQNIQPKALGDFEDDLTFTPLSLPCRIVDTRQSGAGGPLAAGETRKFNFSAAVNQGASDCSITPLSDSVSPSAAALNITAVAIGFAGPPGSYLQAYPDGFSTTTSWLNFAGGQVVASGGILQLGLEINFDIKASAETHVLVDVFGTFAATQASPLACTTIASTSITVPGITQADFVLPTNVCLGSGTSVSAYCYAHNLSNVYLTGSGISLDNGLPFCSWINSNSTPVTVLQGAVCCEVP